MNEADTLPKPVSRGRWRAFALMMGIAAVIPAPLGHAPAPKLPA